jgi:hypothetical protein
MPFKPALTVFPLEKVADNTMNPSSVTDSSSPANTSSVPTMSEEQLISSSELEESVPTQSMALIPYVPSEPASHEADLDLEEPPSLTPGNASSISGSESATIVYANLSPYMATVLFDSDVLTSSLGLPQHAITVAVDQAATNASLTVTEVPLSNYQDFLGHLDQLMNAPMPDLESVLTQIYSRPLRAAFEAAAAFVDTLEEVDIADIAAEDMTCPHCWLPFGTTTDEDNPSILVYPDDEEREISERMNASYELPFCENRPNNDPVKTPCGHVFGRQCLIQSLETNMICPMCRCRFSGDGDQDEDEDDESPLLI